MGASLIARSGLACVVPAASFLFIENRGWGCLFAILLSALAVGYEVFVSLGSQKSGRAAKSKRRGRPWQIFVLQILSLYMIQLWTITLDAGFHVGPQDHEAAGRSHSVHSSAGSSVPVAPPKPAMPERKGAHILNDDPNGPTARLQPPFHKEPAAWTQPQVADSSNPNPAPNPSPPVLSAPVQSVGSGAFQLDAPPESLKWSPKSISVVLPCAEERELALKTVKSVYESTPADVLHEIVVVDDGSNPPLSHTHLKPDVQKQYKVKMERHEDTVGLIGAKKTGGDAASGDLVIFFDCHVAPQSEWYKDFLELISENYRRMVIPQITALDVDSWTQIGGGGGMSKCYVTWDGDFKWGGTDDMYMGMLSGGLLGMSKKWWTETGGYDDQMLGWGGENIDQGVRMWVCGGEIVAAPTSQVAHMWRTGDSKTNAHYKHVGDTLRNRARAIHAWFGEFSAKLDQFPNFAGRKRNEGPNWFGDMTTFQKVKDRLQGCHPFAWYLKRFKVVYEDAGLLPPEIFMIKEEKSGKCLLYQGQAGTSGSGAEGVVLSHCDQSNDRMFWHLGNRNPHTHGCCSGLRAWNTDQCFQGIQPGGKGITGICELSGDNSAQNWKLHNGYLKRGSGKCLGPGDQKDTLAEASCMTFRAKGGARFTKLAATEPLETKLYKKSQLDHPEIFEKLNQKLNAAAADNQPRACKTHKGGCIAIFIADGSNRCLAEDGSLTDEHDSCAAIIVVDETLRLASDQRCLDTWSDNSAETWGFYGCHGGGNQHFLHKGTSSSIQYCAMEQPEHCLEKRSWPPPVDKPAAAAEPAGHKNEAAAAPEKAKKSDFDLDAPPSSLRWDPRTISIVLPCAEERDLAVKTVKSCYEATPESILHEIVVVDDGSNPPLSAKHMTEEFRKKYKVNLRRHESTVGLIGAKKTGGDAASGDIVVFFDCHVAPQRDWYQDFIAQISENYRRMVIPQITALDINTWTQIGAGGGMSKCYVTWDGDFKWGGTDDQYMGMLSGGLLGMSKRWWDETGGYDDQMLGWGGENIDQGVRMWVCGGEIVAAQHAQVAHMWRTGDSKTRAHYHHVGDTIKNRARAVNAWFGEFASKLDHYPTFYERKERGGEKWIGDMKNFQKVKDRLNGCRPFSWYLRRFHTVYEDAGLLPPEIFMLQEEQSGQCLLFLGHAGTSGSGREDVKLEECDATNHRFYWHIGNRDMHTHKCCSGLRAWNTDQCFAGIAGNGRAQTNICELSGRNGQQAWSFHEGRLQHLGQNCLGLHEDSGDLEQRRCNEWDGTGGGMWKKKSTMEPLETKMYKQSQADHPQLFEKLNEQMGLAPGHSGTPVCREQGPCVALILDDGSNRCLDKEGALIPLSESCAEIIKVDDTLRLATDTDKCVDTQSDDRADTWTIYGCHGGPNQQFVHPESTRFCAGQKDTQCFETRLWTSDLSG